MSTEFVPRTIERSNNRNRRPICVDRKYCKMLAESNLREMTLTLIELGNASSLLRFLRNLIRIGISGMGGRSVLANHLADRNFSSQLHLGLVAA